MSSKVSVSRRVAITNIAKRPLVLSLNSKESVHLAPGARSTVIPEHEVISNLDIQKLRERALIAVELQDSTELGHGERASTPSPREK